MPVIHFYKTKNLCNFRKVWMLALVCCSAVIPEYLLCPWVGVTKEKLFNPRDSAQIYSLVVADATQPGMAVLLSSRLG